MVVACGCYSASPLEGLACSETDHCPGGQACDLAFHRCAAFPLCATPAIHDAFDGVLPPCQPWGTHFGDSRVKISSGALEITPRDDGQNSGGCFSGPAAFDDGGIFLEVPQAMPAGHGFVALVAQSSSSSPMISAGDGRLELSVPGSSITTLPYDPVAMRWWRLRPDRAAGATVAEYAADGYHWKRLGAVDVPPEPRMAIEISAGVDTVDPQPTTARLAHLGVCPPRP